MDPKLALSDIIVALTVLGGTISGVIAFWAQRRERRLQAERDKKAEEARLLEVEHHGKTASGEYLTDVGATYATLAQAMERRIQVLTSTIDRLDEKHKTLECRYNELFIESVELKSRMSALEKENNDLLEKLEAREAKIRALETRIAEVENGHRKKGGK